MLPRPWPAVHVEKHIRINQDSTTEDEKRNEGTGVAATRLSSASPLYPGQSSDI